MPQPFRKPPLDYRGQVQLLQQRGMEVSSPDDAAFYLANLNYYRLAAYWLPYEDDHETHRFAPGTSFDKVLGLYVFDRELRLLLLDALERAEVAVRAVWAYELAHAHGSHAHLNPKVHANHKRSNYNGNRVDLRREVQRAKRQEKFIAHLLNTYSEPLPPIWAVCEVMSFGLLSRWYASLSDHQVRQQIARRFDLDEKQLESWLHHLSIVRNICAHHSRLWNREFPVTPAQPRAKPPGMKSRWHSGSRRLFNTLLILLHFMDYSSPGHSWRARLTKQLSVLDAPSGLDAMGFPPHFRLTDI